MIEAPKPVRFIRPVQGGEFVSACSAAVLLVLMFAVKWYGVDQSPGRVNGAERTTAEDAWHGLTLLRWLMLLTIAAAIGSLILHLSQRSHGASTDTNATVTILGALTAALLTYRVLISLPSPASVVDQKLGAYLGLLSAFGVALGGYHALRTARERSRAASRSTPAGSGLANEPQGR